MIQTTRRVATKIGDAYVTQEIAITLPSGATDDDIAAAIAQADRQQALLAKALPLTVPMTDRQSSYIARLCSPLTPEEIASAWHRAGLSVDQVLSRDEASRLIDLLQGIGAERSQAATVAAATVAAATVNEGDYLPF